MGAECTEARAVCHVSCFQNLLDVLRVARDVHVVAIRLDVWIPVAISLGLNNFHKFSVTPIHKTLQEYILFLEHTLSSLAIRPASALRTHPTQPSRMSSSFPHRHRLSLPLPVIPSLLNASRQSPRALSLPRLRTHLRVQVSR